MVDYSPQSTVSNKRTAAEEDSNIAAVLNSPNNFSGVVKSVNGELRHVVFDGDPTSQVLNSLEIEYGTTFEEREP